MKHLFLAATTLILLSFTHDVSAKSPFLVGAKPSITDRFRCPDWFKRLIPASNGGPYAVYRERTSKRLLHELPAGLHEPSESSKRFGLYKSGYPHDDLHHIQQHFRSDREFYQFVDLAESVGFTHVELMSFLQVNGYHRGVEMFLTEFRKNPSKIGLEKRLQELSEYSDVRGPDGRGWMPKLHFRDSPTVKIYRGTMLPASELKRIFRMDWSNYYESYLPSKFTPGPSYFGRGRFFSIDAGIGQSFATKPTPPEKTTERWFKMMVEARVPREKLEKESAMSRWSVGEFQYDSESTKPEEIENFILFLDRDQSVRIPAELLRNGEFSKVREILRSAKVPEGTIRQLLSLP